MKIYIDFDGVICDTLSSIFGDYKKYSQYNKDTNLETYINKYDWEELLKTAPVINHAIEYINRTSYDISILTQVYSLNEAIAKINMLRNNGVTCDIIIVPPHTEKSDVIIPNDSILVDDQMKNLRNWYDKGGKGIFFSKDKLDYDEIKEYNNLFPAVSDLSFIAEKVQSLEKKMQ